VLSRRRLPPVTAEHVAAAANRLWGPRIEFQAYVQKCTVLGLGDIVTACWLDRQHIVTWLIRPHKQSSVLLPRLSTDEDMLRLDALNRAWDQPRTPTVSDALRLIKDTLIVLEALEHVR
jgi:hypothetical protein